MAAHGVMTTHPTSARLAARLSGALERFAGFAHWRESAGPGEKLYFRCNVCGGSCAAPMGALERESPSCRRCGSTVRTRTLVHLLTSELFGRSIALPDLPLRRDLLGIGLSDAKSYANRLSDKLGYTNTFLHRDPRLDITAPPAELCEHYDFIIASEVFEHVAPPVSRAFLSARRLLKPHGVLVFSVPYTLDPDTHEHYPELYDYRVVQSDGCWRLENRTADGRVQIYTDPVFHGGPGSTLEMRRFSRSGLIREFTDAGFAGVRIADEAQLEYGIVWPHPWSVPMVAYRTLDR
jgi:SAM-dependent methyltransferase